MIIQKNDFFRATEEKFWDYTYANESMPALSARHASFHEHFRHPLKQLSQNAIIVELGCGTRVDSFEIAQTGKTVFATDISTHALKKAREFVQRIDQSVNIDFIRAEALHLPFRDSSINGILMAASFHHIEHPHECLEEIKRVSKHDAIIVFGVEPNSWPYHTIYKILNPLKKYIRKKRDRKIDSIADDHTKGFSKKTILKLLDDHDFKVLEIKRVKYLLEWYDSYIRLRKRFSKKQHEPLKSVERLLDTIDTIIARIPGINFFNWHWNIIAQVQKRAYV
ncbi:MAG: class I SAM-dependent methyltransferase [Patescibacteria group bacterium]|nr:class I SAM-dependent methyltransferase [Patescibacteria group bacterium]